MQGADVQPILSPDPQAMRQHLEHLFGGDLDGAHDGLVELAWSDGRDPGHPLRHGMHYGTDAFDALIEEACRINVVPMQNVYIGPALRKPGTFPGGRASDEDAYALPAYYVDLDDPGVAEMAKNLYRGCPPTLVVVTGRRPYLRTQLWWKHESPERDFAKTRAQLAVLCAAFHGDPVVVNPSRVMRLGGSIAWPVKAARELERTEVHVYPNPERRSQYANGELARAFPVDPLLSSAGASGLPEGASRPQGLDAPPSTLNLQPFTGTSPDELIARIRSGAGGWHNDVLRLVGHWVDRGWTDAEILASAESLTLSGYTVAQTRADMWTMIKGGRAKWNKPNPRIDLDAGLAQQQAEEDSDAGPFPASSLIGEPPARRWVIPDWLPAGEATGLYGDGGVGKTLLAQQIAAAVATGSPFMGLETHQMPVLAVLCEDDKDELHRRQHAINRWLDCAMHPHLQDLGLWPRVGKENFLAVYGREGQHQLTPFYQRLFSIVTEIKGDKLVILDTLADLFGGNEIVRLQANHFVKAVIGRLVRECGATVLVLAHPSQAGLQTGAGSSGSTGWSNAFRQRLYLAKSDQGEGGTYDRVLSRKKANYASANADDELKLVWSEGVLESVRKEQTIVSVDKATRILKDIDARWQQGNPFNPYARSPFFVVPWMMKAHEMSRGEATALIRAWMLNGMVTVEMVSKDTKRQGMRVVRWPGDVSVSH